MRINAKDSAFNRTISKIFSSPSMSCWSSSTSAFLWRCCLDPDPFGFVSWGPAVVDELLVGGLASPTGAPVETSSMRFLRSLPVWYTQKSFNMAAPSSWLINENRWVLTSWGLRRRTCRRDRTGCSTGSRRQRLRTELVVPRVGDLVLDLTHALQLGHSGVDLAPKLHFSPIFSSRSDSPLPHPFYGYEITRAFKFFIKT